ncbi:MAG TPA: hypothetical protein PLZ57_00045 [Pseudobdellovibrionaceae bacterium]|nr:hypothetical protein [Pseudobdellovibrionaceae bacterium]
MSTPLGRIGRRGLLVISAFASGLPAPSLWHFGEAAQAHESAQVDAQRAYRESTQHMASRINQLMGQRVQLPSRGDVIVRQALAPNGRVMRQMLLSKDISEIQLDEDADGVVDLWEVKRGHLTVTASDPLRGRFMRLTVSDKVKQGILKAEYLLASDGREYALWRATIERAKVMRWDESVESPSVHHHDNAIEPTSPRAPILIADNRSTLERLTGVRRPSAAPALVSTPVPTPTPRPRVVSAFIDTRPVAAMQPTEVSVQAQECSEFVGPLPREAAQRCEQLIREWRRFGDHIGVGTDLLCDLNPDNNLARLQMSWWNVLQQMNGQSSLLSRLRDTSDPSKSMFSDSCFAPNRREDFEKLTEGLAEVMGTSAGLDQSVVQPGSTPNPNAPRSLRNRQGPFLACLERNGLAATAARIERNFYLGLEFPHLRTNRPLACNFNDSTGSQNPGNYYPGHEQVEIRMTAAQAGQSRDERGTPLNYANVLFHEYIHSAGISSEPFTYTAVACCGNPPGSNQEQACSQLRGMVNEEMRLKQLEVLFGPRVQNAESTYNFIQQRYGPEVADRLSREFLLGLDREGAAVQPYGRLMDPDALRRCVAAESRDACVNKWTAAIGQYLDGFTNNVCPGIVSWAYRGDVDVTEDTYRTACREISGRIRTGLESGMRDMIRDTAAGQCTPARTATEFNFDASRWLAALFGVQPAIASADPDCAFSDQAPQQPWVGGDPGVGSTPLPVVVATPSQHASDDPHADNSRVGPRPDPDQAPLSRSQPRREVVSARDRLSQYSQSPSTEISRIAPRPVVRIDTESRQGVATVEKRLREATDFVGAAARGLDRLKDVAIPRAQAAEKSNPSRIASATTDYVPFRAPSRSVENGGRIPSSVSMSDPGEGSAAPGVRLVSSRSAGPGAKAAGGVNGSAARGGPGSGPGASAAADVDGAAINGSGVTLPPAHLGARESDPQRVPAAGSAAQTDLLAPILSRPWREIAGNLKNAVVVQALVDQRIVIVDPSGRRIGSRVPTRTYRFIGLDKPLKLDQRVPASRP